MIVRPDEVNTIDQDLLVLELVSKGLKVIRKTLAEVDEHSTMSETGKLKMYQL